MTAPVVTALRARGGRSHGGQRVEVELDGRPWRVVPLEAAVRASLAVGRELDRPSARMLGRELKRLEARAVALRALRSRDHTTASLERRLAERGTAPSLRQETVEAAERAGLVDDARFAAGRAALLAGRGAGDLLIADDLERHGVPAESIPAALAALEPERTRVERLVEARGRSARTLRLLASRGFSEEALESLVADMAADGLG
jgi:SOS response regulatory protein OraA/RecX